MFKSLNAKAYLVGGAVRDQLLGMEPKDLDYVVEATQEEFEAVFPDAERVGNSFPVYMIEGCEVALTRTERSTGTGYTDFEYVAGVPIEDDLGRRDFTFNSIARHYVTGDLVDPHNGAEDLSKNVLRSINPSAFEDDPLRMIRACRFVSRFGSVIHPTTLRALCRNANLVETVNPERIEAELQKMYAQSDKPSVFFNLMAVTGLLQHHFEPLEALRHVPAGPVMHHGANTAFDHTMEAVDRCKAYGYSFEVFMAVLCHDFGKATTPKDVLPHHYGHEVRSEEIAGNWLAKHRFSYCVYKLVLVVARNHMKIHSVPEMKPRTLVKFVRSIRRELFDDFYRACNCDHPVSEETDVLISRVEQVIRCTKIELPVGMKGKENITNYINNQYVTALQCSAKEIK